MTHTLRSLIILCILLSIPGVLLAQNHKPTVIKSLNGERFAIWPDQLPEAVQKNWKSIVPLFICINPKDPAQNIPEGIPHQSFGTGYLVHTGDQFYVLSVAHIFTMAMQNVVAMTEYTPKTLRMEIYIIENYDKSFVRGIKLDLKVFEEAPVDLAVFRVDVPHLSAPDPILYGIYPQASPADWTTIEQKMPNINLILKSAGRMKLALPKIGSSIHLAGFTAIGQMGIIPFHWVGFLISYGKALLSPEKENKNIFYLTMRGQAVHGMSGGFVVDNEGNILGVFSQGTSDGMILWAISAHDLFSFLQRHQLAYLADASGLS